MSIVCSSPLFDGFPRPSVSDAVVPVRPELLLHSLTVITQIGKFYNNMIIMEQSLIYVSTGILVCQHLS